jgi:hypothetical protein
MAEQSFKNHGRYVFMFHIVTYLAIIAVIIGSIVNLANSSKENLYSASLLVVVSLILASLAWFGRSFALRAQDRAIRAEENFRHFILTGKPLDGRLRLEQIIALRFAADEEFALLCEQAIDKNLNAVEIKKAIRSWRADHHRA